MGAFRHDEEPLTEFHFGCNADRIEWDDKEFSHMEIAPAVIISIDFTEMLGMPENAAATQTIQKLMLRGPYRRRAREALSEAIRLERHRIAVGRGTGDDLAPIREQLEKCRSAMFANFRAALRNKIRGYNVSSVLLNV